MYKTNRTFGDFLPDWTASKLTQNNLPESRSKCMIAKKTNRRQNVYFAL